jgi:hypothetical protein
MRYLYDTNIFICYFAGETIVDSWEHLTFVKTLFLSLRRQAW